MLSHLHLCSPRSADTPLYFTATPSAQHATPQCGLQLPAQHIILCAACATAALQHIQYLSLCLHSLGTFSNIDCVFLHQTSQQSHKLTLCCNFIETMEMPSHFLVHIYGRLTPMSLESFSICIKTIEKIR